ncbi:MAG: hypothetical protein DDT18_00981 [Actinobacteria bacterium]|nr:hypothetical protein [Actinomycetota bacterium]
MPRPELPLRVKIPGVELSRSIKWPLPLKTTFPGVELNKTAAILSLYPINVAGDATVNVPPAPAVWFPPKSMY